MANKELTAKVKLDVRDAEAKLKRLTALISNINKAVGNSSRNSKLESALNKQVIAAEKVRQTTLRTKLAEEKLTAQKLRTASAVERAKEASVKTQIAEQRLAAQTARTLATVERINNAKAKAVNKVTSIVGKVKSWATNQKQVTSAANSTNRVLSAIGSKLRGIAATYLGIMGTRALVNTSDIITSAENKLNYVNAKTLGEAGTNADGTYSSATINATQDSMDKMYASSQKVRMSYTDMMSNVSKSMALASGAFQDSTDNAIRFQEIMAEAYAVGGASAEEMSTSMYQLIQALGSGQLAGDELRSVREGAPLAYKAIENFVQGVYNSEESLKDLASQGKVTSDMVVAAIMTSGDEMDKAFAQTKQTFAQTWDQIKNAAVRAFQPVAKTLTDTLNEAIDNGMVKKIESAFVSISKALQIVFKLIAKSVVWIVDNWDWLQHVIVAGLLVIAGMWVWQAGVAVMSAIATLLSLSAVQWAIIGIITAILSLVFIFYLWKTGAIDTCNAIIYALLVVAVVLLVIAIVATSGIALIVAAVIAAIALILYYLDYFLGIVYSIGAAIYNIVLGVLDGIIQCFWSIFVDPIKSIIEWFVNAWNGAFDGVGGAFANFCGQLLSGLIGLVKPFAKLLDKIFGWDTNGAIESAQAAMKSWGKTDAAVTYSVEAPTAASLLGKVGLNLPERISYTDAWNTGMSHGASAKDWLNGLGSNAQTGLGDFSLDDMGKKLGLDFSGLTGFPDEAAGQGYSYPSADDLLSGVDGLNDSVGDIADSMDLTEEDLSYLRKIAEMEWKREYTTASITVDMSNYNTVSGDGDLDGIVTKLADKLYEEMDYLANGVYA